MALIKQQRQRLANNENGGLLTFGAASALWSSSAALVSIVGALNRAVRHKGRATVVEGLREDKKAKDIRRE